MRNKIVVITSIYPPGKAVAEIAKQGHKLIIVGDKKTPSGWTYEDVVFLSVEQQQELDHALTQLLPFNHYGRKMIGYLEAMRLGADTIIDTDDDNIPKANWSFPEFDGQFAISAEELGFVNAYAYYSDMHIWPRGLPLDRINNPLKPVDEKEVRVGVWQGLADGDPDVDAIYRLVSNKPCTFNHASPVVLGTGTLSPFNSQNTAFRKELFPLLYLPAYVTFRFTDILRGWVAQPIMSAAGYSLGFTNATVVQERNPHDYTKDFESEIPCYLHGNAIAEALASIVRADRSVGENLFACYTKLRAMDIVTDQELELLGAWIKDVEKLVR